MVAGLFGWACGVALQLQQQVLWPAVAYLAAAGGALLLLAIRGRMARPAGRAACAALVAGILAFAFTGARALLENAQVLDATLEGQDVVLVGHVAGLPQVYRSGAASARFVFAVDRATWADRPAKVPDRVLLYGAGPLLEVAPGQRWQFTVRLRRPHGLRNPGGFDTEAWLWEQGLHATGTVRQGKQADPPLLLPGSVWRPVDQARFAVRQAIFRQVHDPGAAGLLAALAVGDQSSIDKPDWDVFKVVGVGHLVSVSGLHITLFAWLTVGGVGVLWRRLGRHWPGCLHRWPVPVVASWGGVALAAAYAVFSGWAVPAQRTVLMLTAMTWVRLRAHTWPWPVTWLVVFDTVLLLDPWALLQSGFWLSFVAVGLLFAALPAHTGSAGGVLQVVWAKAREQAVVTIGLAPLTLLLFGQVSVVGLLANLAAVPWVTFVITPLALLGALFAPLWAVGAWSSQGLMALLQWLATWPGAALERPELPGGLGLLAVVGGLLLVLRLPWAMRAWGGLLLWPALAYQPPRPPVGAFEMWAADVGQGTATVVRTARHTLVYDTGPPIGASNAGDRVLLPMLRTWGDQPEVLVLSHNDNDHTGGFAPLMRRFPRAQVLANFEPEVAVNRLRPCQKGQVWEWDGVRFEVLHPSDDYPVKTDNARSCVIRVGQGAESAWLTGDITRAEEVHLLPMFQEAASGVARQAGVLMAGHHGSKTSNSEMWLHTLQPRWVVVQAGLHSRYGHPAPEVVQRFEALGLPWVNTADCGAVHWRSDAPEALHCFRREHQRYWHWQMPALAPSWTPNQDPELP